MEVTQLENKEQFLDYLNGKYFLLNNVMFLQGLFLACEATELYEMCVEYAKTEAQTIFFFEKKILETGKNVYFNYFVVKVLLFTIPWYNISTCTYCEFYKLIFFVKNNNTQMNK